MTMIAKYYWTVIVRALQETLTGFELGEKKDSVKIFIAFVIFAVSSTIGIIWQGASFNTILIGLLGPVAAGVLVCVYKLFAIPVILAKEQQNALSQLKKETQDTIEQLKRENQNGLGKLQVENERLLDERLPRVDFLFAEGKGAFDQRMPIGEVGGIRRIIRIGIHNKSLSRSIEGLRIDLEAIEPSIMESLPVPLHQMHGINNNVLNPDETRYVEVVSFFSELGSGEDAAPYRENYQIHHTIEGVSTLIPRSMYLLTIAVRGIDLPPTRITVAIGLNAQFSNYVELHQLTNVTVSRIT